MYDTHNKLSQSEVLKTVADNCKMHSFENTSFLISLVLTKMDRMLISVQTAKCLMHACSAVAAGRHELPSWTCLTKCSFRPCLRHYSVGVTCHETQSPDVTLFCQSLSCVKTNCSWRWIGGGSVLGWDFIIVKGNWHLSAASVPRAVDCEDRASNASQYHPAVLMLVRIALHAR